MNKFFTVITTAVIAASIPASVMADPIVMGDENRVIEAGVEYLIPSFKQSSGIYTSPVASRIYLSGAQDLNPYTSPDHSPESLIITNNLDNTGHERWFDALEGQVIYFYTSFAMNENVFVLYQEGVTDKPLEISLLQPAENQRVDFNNFPSITATFNQEIKLASSAATITFTDRLSGEKMEIPTRATAGGQTLTVSMYNQLRPYMAAGNITNGDEYTVTVAGLTTKEGTPYAGADADGNVVFTYLCGALPVTATQQFCPEPFMSYWPQGAPEGIFTMEFDADLMDDGKTFVELGWGNMEGNDGEYYAEQIVCKIDGNKLSADFTGKLRTPATMTPMFPNASYSTMSIKLNNVRDKSGMPVASPGQGTIGSYSFLSNYKLVERSLVITEFSPASGSLLSDAKNVNVWISGLKAIRFDGFTLTITDKDNKVSTRTIAMKDVDVIYSDENEGEYEFPMPADVLANAKRVEITLSNLVSLDGYDHDNDVRCIYGGFTVLSSTPRNGESLALLAAGSEISMRNNLSATYPSLYVEYQVEDADHSNGNPVVKAATWMNRAEDGSYTASVARDVKLIAGHDYKVVFTAWENETTRNITPEQNLGSDYIIIKGLTPAYRYSSLTLSSTVPAENDVLSDEVSEIRLYFDGYVSLGKYTGSDLRTFINLGYGETLPFKEVTPIQPIDAEGTTVATEWVLTLPDNYVASLTGPLDISFTAYDQDGIQLRGNEGEEENACYHFSWQVAGQFATAEIAPVGEFPYSSVSEFTASHEAGINLSWNLPIESAVVMMGDEVVANVSKVNIPEADASEKVTSLTLCLDKTVNVKGKFTLVIPEDYFVFGEQTAILTGAAQTIEFEIVEGTGVETITDAASADVYTATGILLIRNADEDAIRALAPGLYIIGGRKVMIR